MVCQKCLGIGNVDSIQGDSIGLRRTRVKLKCRQIRCGDTFGLKIDRKILIFSSELLTGCLTDEWKCSTQSILEKNVNNVRFCRINSGATRDRFFILRVSLKRVFFGPEAENPCILCGWVNRIRTYIDGVRVRCPAIGRSPRKFYVSLIHYSSLSVNKILAFIAAVW